MEIRKGEMEPVQRKKAIFELIGEKKKKQSERKNKAGRETREEVEEDERENERQRSTLYSFSRIAREQD